MARSIRFAPYRAARRAARRALARSLRLRAALLAPRRPAPGLPAARARLLGGVATLAPIGPARRRLALQGCAAAAALAAALAAPAPAGAAPRGGVVKGGAAEIVTRGDLTVIRQGGRRLIIDWTSFDIGADEIVKFIQPGRDSVALNRVLDGLPTEIRGKLLANGNVWLVNPSGVMFRAGSVVDVGGLVATTADIENDAFMAGGGTFKGKAAPGAKIVNQGSITFAQAGMVGLVAPEVENQGVIAGKLGKIVIAGQESFSVDVSGDGLFEIDLKDAARTRGARASNSGLLVAEGGTVIITAATARDAVEAAVSVGGVIEAKSARVDGGTIVLDGGAGDVVVTGTLDASGGDGAKGGRVDVTGGTVRLASGSKIDVSGGIGGGTARIGGGLHGADETAGGLRAARVTVMDEGARIDADARLDGDGGEVALWSSAATWMGGKISARGGATAGDGGFVEISSKLGLGFEGVVDLSASAGAFGLLLLDPRDVRIVADGQGGSAIAGSILAGSSPGADLTIAASSISASMASLSIEATRDISVESAIANRRPGVSLTLSAGRDLLLSADVVVRGNLTLKADAAFAGAPADGVGAIRVLNGLRIASEFQDLSLSAAEGILGPTMAPGDVLTVQTTGALSLPATSLAGGLSVAAFGPLIGSSVAAASLDISTGSIAFSGPLTIAGDADLVSHGGAITAASAANVFGGTVSLDTTGLGQPAAAATLAASGTLTLGDVAATTLDLTVAGDVGQAASGVIDASGASTIVATGDVRLENANLFGGVVSVAGVEVSVTDADSLDLAEVTATESLEAKALAGDLTIARALVGDGAGALSAGADGGSVRLADVIAGDAAIGGATGGATQDVVIERAALGALGIAAAGDAAGENGVRLSGVVLGGDFTVTGGAADVTLDGVTLGTGAAFDPGSTTGTLTLHRVRVAGDLSATVQGDIRLGLVEATAGAAGDGDVTLVSLGGDIARLSENGIDFAAAGDGTLTIALPGGKTTQVAAAALAPYAYLLATAGDLSLDAAGRVRLPSATRPLDAAAFLVHVGGEAALAAGEDLVLAHAGALTLGSASVGGDAALKTVGGGLAQTGGVGVAGTLALDIEGNAALGRADNAFHVVSGRIDGGLALRDADGFAATDIRAAGLTIAGQAGLLTLRDVATTGAISAEAGSIDAARLDAGAGVALTAASGGIEAHDVQAAGALRLTAATTGLGEVSLARFVAGSLEITAGGGAQATDGAAGATTIGAGAGLTAENLRLGEASLTAGTDLRAAAMTADALTLQAGGDIGIGALAVAGDLSATAGGRIDTVEDAPAGLEAVAIAGVGGAGLGIATDADLGDAEQGRQRLHLAAGEGAALGAQTIADLVSVGGRADFAAATILVDREPAETGGRHNRFAGVVSLTSTGDATLEAAGALGLSGADVGGDMTVRANADGADHSGGAGITQTGSLSVAGTAAFFTGEGAAPAAAQRADVLLDDAGNHFAEVTVVAATATLADADGFTVRDGDLTGALLIGTAESPQAGPVTLADIFAEGGAQVVAWGAIDATRLELGADSLLASGEAGTSATDIDVAGRLEVSGAGEVSLLRVAAGQIDAWSLAAVSIADSTADDAVARGASVAVDSSAFGTLTADAGGRIDVTDTSADAFDLDAGGDVSIAGATGGDFLIDAGGRIDIADTTADTIEAQAWTGLAWTDVDVADAATANVEAGGASFLRVSAGDATLTALGDIEATDSDFVTLLAQSGAHLTIAGSSFADFAHAVGVDGLDISGSTGGEAIAISYGAISVADSAFDVLATQAGTGSTWTDVDVAGIAIANVDDGDAQLLRVSAGEATLTVRGDVSVADSSFGSLDATAEGDVALTGVEADELIVHAGAEIVGTLAAASSEGEGEGEGAGPGDAILEDVVAGAAEIDAARDVMIEASSFDGLEARAGRDLAIDGTDAGPATLNAGRDLTARDSTLGAASLTSGEDMVLRRSSLRGATLYAAGDATLSDLETGALSVFAAGALDARRLDAGALNAGSGGAMTLADVAFRRAALTAGEGLEARRLAGGALTASAGTDATLTDLDVARATLSATGDLSARRVATARDLDVSGRDLTFADVQAGRDATLTAAGTLDAGRLTTARDATLDAGDAASLDRLDIGRGLTARADLDGSAEGVALRLRDVQAGRMDLEAGGSIDLDTVAVAGRASAYAHAGDLLLGALAVGGDLLARAGGGSIRTRAGDADIAPWVVAAPEAPAAPRDVPGQGDGGEGEGGDDEPPILIIHVTEGAPVEFANLVQVDGGAVFDASGSVLLAAERGADGRDNDFRGRVEVSGARHVAISDLDDLKLGGGGIHEHGPGAVRTVNLRVGGDLTQTDGSRIETSGDVHVRAQGDVRLDSATNAIGGTFAAEARDVTIATAGDLRLGPLSLRGDLVATAGASGRGYASIVQADVANVTRLEMERGVAADGMIAISGPIRIDGDAEFATGADPAKTVSDRGAKLRLDRGDNVFGGDVSVRRIFGAVTLIEESTPGSLHTDAHDAGWLRFGSFEAGGDVLIQTSDNVVFMGRLTALTDEMRPHGPPPAPGAAGPDDWRAQGAPGVPVDDLRLFLPDGTTFKVDATAGGADPDGGWIRFDRPVDGANHLSNARDPDAVASRGGAGALTLNAGARGEVRFRDYVGASNPIGPLTIVSAGDVSFGQTYAEKDADPLDDPDRFLLASGGKTDIVSAGPISIDATGEVKIHMPAGLLQEFEDDDDYYGLNTPSLTYGLSVEPDSLSLFGYIGDSGRKAAGLYPVGPKGSDYKLNGCVIGDVQDCTGVSPPRVLTLVQIDQPEILNVQEEDLLELFVSYGNEELWGVPDGYFEDSDLARAREEANRQANAEQEEEQEEDRQAANAPLAGPER